MNKLIYRCLFFAFLSLFIGACLSSAHYLYCMAKFSMSQCQSTLATATSSWTNAATMVLAVAVQSSKTDG